MTSTSNKPTTILTEEHQHTEGTVKTYELKGGNIKVRISSFGGTILSIETPNKLGVYEDIALGLQGNNSQAWESEPNHPYFGSTIGRYCNRLGGSKFALAGKVYNVSPNEKGTTCLHGGFKGFSAHVWNVDRAENGSILFSRVSEDLEEGFPGRLFVQTEYRVDEKGSLIMVFNAELLTNQPTIVNMTNHVYLNLGGENCGRDISGHLLQIRSKQTLEMDDKTLIPSGELVSLIGTCLDFNEAREIGTHLSETLRASGNPGIDHNFILDDYIPGGSHLRHVAKVADPISGRILDISTTQPGLQVYTGNWLADTEIHSKSNGGRYRRYAGIALETQHFPDSPNHPNFPSTVLLPGQKYHEETIFSFSLLP